MIHERASIRVRAVPHNRVVVGDPAARAGDRWFRAPILWLGIALFAASIAGCILTIVLALRYADTPLAVDGAQLLKVPAAQAPPGGADGPEARQ